MPVNLDGIEESHRPYEESEKQALIKIYEACGGREWKKNGRWLKNPEPSTWFGVVVEEVCEQNAARICYRNDGARPPP